MTYNLTDSSVKLGELNLDKSQFALPKKASILSARVNYVHETINGESVSTDQIAKVTCQIQDADKVKALKEMGISVEDLKAITLEIHDNLDKVVKLAKNDGLIDKTVEPVNPQVRLMWHISRRGWAGVKLVATDIKVLGDWP
ncbi:hypothetical protein [Streptococcus pluranimalium]|uniref:hypothetical protein n=1 Tax=Streptococcus pluranimalium TaxID=82348 RepID=UPI0039FDBBC5